MKRTTTTASLLLAGLLATAGAWAQSTSSASSNVPLQAGEASTVSRGAPNLAPTAVTVEPAPAAETGTLGAGPSVVAPAEPADGTSPQAYGAPQVAPQSSSAGRYDRHERVASVPLQAGEASTLVNGQPNGNPDDPLVQRQRGTSMGYGTAPQVWRSPGVAQ